LAGLYQRGLLSWVVVTGARELVPDEPAGEGVGGDEGEADGRGAEDGVAEDVEHVVAVVGEGKGVNDGVVFHHGEGDEDREEGVGYGDECGSPGLDGEK